MLYGLYLSATGVMTNSYRQDVIANNLANAETVGFKKDLALFKERLTAAQEMRQSPTWTDPLMEAIGGGTLATPTQVDTTQGELEHTGSNLDMAIIGNGYFAVNDRGQQRLTRNGQFMVDNQGHLILANGKQQQVLDPSGKPIVLDGTLRDVTSVSQDGVITQAGKPVGRIGLFDVPDPSQLSKQGDTLLSYPDPSQVRPSSNSFVRSEFVEHANVDPATELTQLMETQRQLEANANMIRYQDQTLGELVNTVGKIG
jgi:flagellar basal-body rod protein FlgF